MGIQLAALTSDATVRLSVPSTKMDRCDTLRFRMPPKSAASQRLTLVHCSAQPEPFLTQHAP